MREQKMALNMEVQMKKTILLLLGLLLILSGGCATVRGMAEDIQNLGKGLKKTVSDEDDRR